MARIKIVTLIDAPLEACFDLSRDIDFHVKSMSETGERAIAGRTTGLIELDESVTWEAKHLCLKRRFTSKITKFDRPNYFRDEMTNGDFQSFVHDHRFQIVDGKTEMSDEIVLKSPFGVIGELTDLFFMTKYMKDMLAIRAKAIKLEAES